MPRARRSRRTPALIRYGFLALTVLAFATQQPGPALICAAITAFAWKGHPR